MKQTEPEHNGVRPAAPGKRPVIVAAVDGGPSGERVLESAGRLAARTGAYVVVAHVTPMFSVGSVDGEALVDLHRDLEFAVLTQATLVLDPLSVTWRLDVEPGEPAAAIHRIAERNSAALVIVGSCGAGLWVKLRRLVRHSVSTHLIRHEHRPVLVVPPTPRGANQLSGREG